MLDFGPPDKVHEAKKPRPLHKRRLAWVILVVLMIGGLGAAGILANRDKTPVTLPDNIVSSLAFPVYYPSGTPAGFKYIKGSAKLTSGLLYYKFANGSKAISVTEQSVPSGVNLHALPKYSGLTVAIGKAVIGISLGNPSVVILTQNTLINLVSNKNVSQNDITNVAQSFTVLKNQNAYSY